MVGKGRRWGNARLVRRHVARSWAKETREADWNKDRIGRGRQRSQVQKTPVGSGALITGGSWFGCAIDSTHEQAPARPGSPASTLVEAGAADDGAVPAGEWPRSNSQGIHSKTGKRV